MSFLSPERQKAREALRAVRGLLAGHGGMLPDDLHAGLRELCQGWSVLTSPYPAAELDAAKAALDGEFGEYEHFYYCHGEAVTWCARPRDFTRKASISFPRPASAGKNGGPAGAGVNGNGGRA